MAAPLFICHRINTVDELIRINPEYGVEIDVRDDHKSGQVILAHDPFIGGEYLDDYLKEYRHRFLIVNVKSERIEIECLRLLEKYGITDYFFLDSSFPMIYSLKGVANFACRFSEYEPITTFLACSDLYKYIWVDCFTSFPLTVDIYRCIKDMAIVVIVSPELQKQPEKIKDYKDGLAREHIIPQMICCKAYNIERWN